jgi:hypothetical protein
MPRKPTDKQVKFVNYLAANPDANATEAGRAAGYSENTLINVTRDVLEQPGVKPLAEKFQIELHERISNTRIINKLEELMDAKRATNAAILVTKDGKIVKAEEQGLIEVDDAPTQLKTVQVVMQAKQLFGSLAQPTIGTQNNLNITDEQLKRLIGKTD